MARIVSAPEQRRQIRLQAYKEFTLQKLGFRPDCEGPAPALAFSPGRIPHSQAKFGPVGKSHSGEYRC
jgi:hypothetical protein